MTAAVQDKRLVVPAGEVEPWNEPVGAQVPPIFHAPLWNTTAGDDAVDLAAAAGLKLLPWQQLVLRNALGERRGGGWEAFEVGLIVPRQNGKNVIVLARELAGLFLFDEEQIIHTAHKFKSAKSAYRDLKKLIESVPEFRDQVRSMPDSSDNTAIIMNDGRRCDFLARQSGGGRGFSGDTVILDEAFQVSDELVSDLLPTLSGRSSPQVWYTSSTGFDYSTVLKKVRKRAVEEPEDNKHLAYFEWAANVDEVDWRSVDAAQAANPSMGWYQSWDWIKEVEVDSMEEESYKRERLGVWADRSADAAIGVDLWAQTRGTEELFEGNPPVRRSLALDVSQDRDVCVIGGATELRDGTVVVDVIERRAGTAWVVDTLRDLVKRNRPYAGVVIDSLSGAAALHPHLMEAGIPVALAVTKDLTAGTADLYDRLARTDENGDPDPTVFHGDNDFLDDAAHTARRRLVGASKSQWTWEQYGEVSVVPLRAITLALRGFQMQPLKRKRRGRVA
ncbi:terminase large subunit [Corynebacterium pseudokroppenstedtii]|uniref:Terminase large subunit n=1 Tax=Corynebacterium pseudokroppenstedtii TaxID=2804917 RepID=A0AAU0PXW0_9CORY|nr:terminase large subunit [Corynebacterium pseudokroppenstedtii]MCF8703292.1 terminase large subunit [Corynebacterium pseudokroppenstedtii]MCG2636806.1 terminase large subunit [Corynebacterium pseudokroppenstedtii]